MTTLFSNTSGITIAPPKKKQTLLPILTVLFILSYGLMTMLIVEQGAAIQSQSNLIKVLLPESRELWGLKGKALTDKQAGKPQSRSRVQSPAQAPADRAVDPPTNQAESQTHQGRPGKATKAQPQLPPPVPASDLTDQRRMLHTI